METIQKQMVEAKKNERTDAPKKVKKLCKELGFIPGMLKNDKEAHFEFFYNVMP